MLPICTQISNERSITTVATPSCPSVEECKKCMGLFESIDSQLSELALRRKTLMAMRASIAESISAFLSSHDKEEISTKDNRLHLKLESREKLVPLKKKELAEKMLAAFDGDQSQLDAFNEKVYKDQRSVKKVTLKRLKTKPLLLSV